MADTETTVWVKTEMAPDETGYVVTLEASEDVARILTPESALKYAGAVLAAAHAAAYDAAVLKQMQEKLGMPLEHAAGMVSDLRKDRPEQADSLTHPLRLVPGVSQRTQQGFLAVWLGDERLGEWGVEDARQHALHVLESVGVAELDFAYYKSLTEVVGIDKNRALQVVEDLGNYRA